MSRPRAGLTKFNRARHTLVIHLHPSPLQLRGHSPVAIAAPVFECDLLDG